MFQLVCRNNIFSCRKQLLYPISFLWMVCSGGNAVLDRREDLFVRHYMSSRSCSMYMPNHYFSRVGPREFRCPTPRTFAQKRQARWYLTGRVLGGRAVGRVLLSVKAASFEGYCKNSLSNCGCQTVATRFASRTGRRRPAASSQQWNTRTERDVESSVGSLRSEERPIIKCLPCSPTLALSLII